MRKILTKIRRNSKVLLKNEESFSHSYIFIFKYLSMWFTWEFIFHVRMCYFNNHTYKIFMFVFCDGIPSPHTCNFHRIKIENGFFKRNYTSTCLYLQGRTGLKPSWTNKRTKNFSKVISRMTHWGKRFSFRTFFPQ